ncbi:MAG: nucleoside triphosphate pyrophosphohydrolase [Ignavibacteria bacterium RIFOXYB2_FULL_35_12]|nr:MAG: nucleoside triphosphate pyrophosphohydrolase [Ignavibacteria bacterium GWA2_36_19]OGU52749.1 MAG: nucleoside triphosphate pyrophosphohydrolase [Ignavibacteria bacterium GWC2_35_8]OGU56187.1 MAG: nucleoside triphosphate pyrophosphohydrolase [Ignavibacteria bacterium GWF2_35_20]OGU83384.1 MAG: nucleoside triphosphate pyrophosphohydrolase [Ignavibacteria bacterium RIFOXYA2_FULL_35_9]OGU86699.1 MAG: nucleoside triphosphate pyrophosphohydrolase [Ignavibacteria bacterium RIFOXYC12_FULL_35_11]
MTSTKFNEFVDIVKRLRNECPWDREQTNDSIKHATLEEAHEVVEAIDNSDDDELKKELGDLLLHVVFHTVIAEGSGKFTLDEVIDSITEKLIRRHPHVFGNEKVTDAEHVKKNWETIKLQEGRDSVLEGVPENLPALQKAHRLQEKAAKVGFDWEKKSDVWKKVIEEIEEMHEIEQVKSQMSNVKSKINEMLESEVGDVFFALVNYARFLGINPENALRKTNRKFIERFKFVEKKIIASGKSLNESTLAEMDKYWNESKQLFS